MDKLKILEDMEWCLIDGWEWDRHASLSNEIITHALEDEEDLKFLYTRLNKGRKTVKSLENCLQQSLRNKIEELKGTDHV